MRSLARFLTIFFFSGLAVHAQGQAARPQFRPAVLGSGPNSLVNKIDTEDLRKKGQKSGAVMFCAVLNPAGEPLIGWTYRGMPGTEALEAELAKRLEESKFTPAIYNHQPAGVMVYGTVIFTPESKPSLRIFLNQDPLELKNAADFVGPQPVYGSDSMFKGLNLPERELPVIVTAVVDLGLTVDKNGKLVEMRVIAEEPPLLGFADAALADFRGAKFIPAFRSGDPTESNTVLPVCYKPAPDPGPSLSDGLQIRGGG